ncbi:MAG TPA: CBS domain-containing protein [Limnochordales bacterium]
MQAKDIMQRNVRTIGPDATVAEVAAILAEAGYSGLPVVDEENRVIGIVTEADLLVRAKRLNLPTFFPFLGGVIFLENPRRFEEELRKATAVRVREVMTTDVVTVSEDTPVQDVATLMVEHRINRVPVVRDGRLVGLITRDDIIRAVHLGAVGAGAGQAGGESEGEGR